MFYRMVEVVSSGALTRSGGAKNNGQTPAIFCPRGSLESFSLLKPMVHWWFWMVFGWFASNDIVQVGQPIFGLRSYMFMIINIQTYYCIYILYT